MRLARALFAASIASSIASSIGACAAQRSVGVAPVPTRPAPQTNRAAEDWSALADPSLRTEPLDSLKYLRLRDADPHAFLSLGLTLRERAESTSAPLFGVTGRGSSAYDLHRLQLHADLHLDRRWNVFLQVEDVRAPGKYVVVSVDENPVDLRQAFVMFQHAFATGTFKVRVGRQKLSIDLQRFISLRDGPNVQQGFDGAWAAWDSPAWKLVALASLPVDHQREGWFDDRSSFDDRLSLVRLERRLGGAVSASAYYARYDRPDVKYVDAMGEEKRDILDARFVGAAAGVNWDLEAMAQGGSIGGKDIRAWAAGARAGYSFHPPLATRLGLQLDGASGDRHAGDDRLDTFTPLFPNGYYFTLSSFTGYANLIHVRPSLTQKLTQDVTVVASWGLQWRESTADAIYLHPMTPLAGTADRGGRWTGSYLQLRSEAKFGSRIVVAGEFVHYQAGAAIRAAGGANSECAGIEMKLSY